MNILFRFIVLLCGVFLTFVVNAEQLPPNVMAFVPAGFVVLKSSSGDLNGDGLIDYVVVLHHRNESIIYQKTSVAPKRPLLLITQVNKQEYILAVRNDDVVLGVNASTQCDPFDEDAGAIVISGRFFTVEHGVACGQHWTDFITFKYSVGLKTWVFHKRIYQSWVMGDRSGAEALKLGYEHVDLGKKSAPILLKNYVSSASKL